MALLGCFKDYRSIENICGVIQGEGFTEVDFYYLGGLWVLLDFNPSVSRDRFLNHACFNTWFSDLKPWHDDFYVSDRIVRVGVEGVPLLAWCNYTFNKIVSKWGKLLTLEN